MSAPLRRHDADDHEADCRCLCGSLLARIVDDAVELKCRRCKRTTLVPLQELPTTSRPEAPSPESRSRVRRAARVGVTP